MSAAWKIECTDGKKDPVTLSVGKTVIGRGHLLQIRELKVSRHHAEVQITQDGEFILKAMHPGLPCYYKKKGDKSQTDLIRGSTIKLEDGDVFSLHSNPDCEFKISQNAEDSTDAGEPDDDGLPTSTVKDEEENNKPGSVEGDKEEADEESEEEEEKEEADGSDWSEEEPKKKSKTSRTKKSRSKKPPARKSRKPPAKKRKPVSSEEEASRSDGSEESDASESRGRRSRRQPARQPAKLPPRRATKPVSYNEDLLIDGLTPSESEKESDDGLPKIGRQKKPDSDSDFKMDEDSGSDWEDAPSKSSRRSGPPPKITPSRRGRRKRDSDSDDEPEYVPRPSRRNRAPVARTEERSKCKYGDSCYRKNKEHKEDFIHPGDSDWSDSSQDDEDKGSEKEQSEKDQSDKAESDKGQSEKDEESE